MAVMQSSPLVQRTVKVGPAPAVCGVPTGSGQVMCVGARWMEAGTGRRVKGVIGRRRRKRGGGANSESVLGRQGWTNEWRGRKWKQHIHTCNTHTHLHTLTTTPSHPIIIIMQV